MLGLGCRAVPQAMPFSMSGLPRASMAVSRSALTTSTPRASSFSSLASSSSSPALPRSQLRPSLLATTPAFTSGPGLNFTSNLQPQLQTQIRSFSASPSLFIKARETYNPSRRVQKRRHGFLSRVRTRTGRKILARRKAKGRKFLSY